MNAGAAVVAGGLVVARGRGGRPRRSAAPGSGRLGRGAGGRRRRARAPAHVQRSRRRARPRGGLARGAAPRRRGGAAAAGSVLVCVAGVTAPTRNTPPFHHQTPSATTSAAKITQRDDPHRDLPLVAQLDGLARLDLDFLAAKLCL